MRAMAARRWPDESSRQLYISLAAEARAVAWVARDEGTPSVSRLRMRSKTNGFVSDLFVEPSFRRPGHRLAMLREARAMRATESLGGLLDAERHRRSRFSLRSADRLAGAVTSLRRRDSERRRTAGDGGRRLSVLDVADRSAAHATILAALDREARGTEQTARSRGLRTNRDGHAASDQRRMRRLRLRLARRAHRADGLRSSAYLTQIFGFALVASAAHLRCVVVHGPRAGK